MFYVPISIRTDDTIFRTILICKPVWSSLAYSANVCIGEGEPGTEDYDKITLSLRNWL